jgi:hypothetical protein
MARRGAAPAQGKSTNCGAALKHCFIHLPPCVNRRGEPPDSQLPGFFAAPE